MRCLRGLLYVSLCLIAVLLGNALSENYHSTPPEPQPLCDPLTGECLLPQIRLVHSNLPVIQTSEPIAKRDVSVIFYLQCSYKIEMGRVSGSGTLCYYDARNNDAYVISCGHLFDGNKVPGENKFRNAKIIAFYKNDAKLSTAESFDAEVICTSSQEDISMLKFKPNWVPNHWFPVAPANYNIREGDRLESVGCDHGQETAAYTVEVVNGVDTGRNLVTKNNSPRPGRSGGGLMTQDGYYVGVVWGTSKLDGTGYGYNVPLRRIHPYLTKYPETKFLLSVAAVPEMFDRLPIVNSDGKQFIAPHGYIPAPKASAQFVSPK